MIELHLCGRAVSGGRPALVAFVREATPFYESPGGIRVRLLLDMADPDGFVEVIEYADRDSYERDQARVDGDPQMREYLHRWHTLLADPPQVSVYEATSAA